MRSAFDGVIDMLPPSRILLADDNEAQVETWRRCLSVLDCEIDVATPGDDLLDRALRDHPHVIVFNPSISEASGFDVCLQIKSNPRTRKVMILMVSPVDDIQVVERAIAAGIDDFLSAPANGCELLKRIEILLKLSHL